MKNITLILSFLILNLLSCKAQNTISLEDAAIYPEQPDGRQLPQNVTYLKDINNSLDKFVGTWSGNYDGKLYEFKFIKQINYGSSNGKIKRDRLVGRLRVKNSNGAIIYNTFNEFDDLKTKFWGDNFQKNLTAYVMYFFGNSIGCAEYGSIHLIVKSNVPNNMNIVFLPDNDIVKEGVCPSNFIPTIPYRKTITLIKQ